MTRLSPKEHLGEFYGLYSTVGRFATIVGPILWGFIVNTLNLGRNTAMLSLVVLLMISFFIIRGVSDERNFVIKLLEKEKPFFFLNMFNSSRVFLVFLLKIHFQLSAFAASL